MKNKAFIRQIVIKKIMRIWQRWSSLNQKEAFWKKVTKMGIILYRIMLVYRANWKKVMQKCLIRTKIFKIRPLNLILIFILMILMYNSRPNRRLSWVRKNFFLLLSSKVGRILFKLMRRKKLRMSLLIMCIKLNKNYL